MLFWEESDMPKKVIMRSVVGCASGFGFGAVVMLLFPLSLCLPSFAKFFFATIFVPINAPVNWFVSVLSDCGLMPYGDNGFLAMYIVYSMMMLAQCSLIGLLVGLCSAFIPKGLSK